MALIFLLIFMLLFSIFYGISVLPESLSKKMPLQSYRVCGMIRKVSFAFLFLFTILQIFFVFFLNENNQRFFPGFGWIWSVMIGLVMAVPATWIMNAATQAAKKEPYAPDKDTKMYGGIYSAMRHPQAVGDVLYWFVLVFLLNSKTLFQINLLWIPLNIAIAFIEEYDLKKRFGDEYRTYMKGTNMFIPVKFLGKIGGR